MVGREGRGRRDIEMCSNIGDYVDFFWKTKLTTNIFGFVDTTKAV